MTGTLGTPAQLDFERLVLRLIDSDEVQEAARSLREAYAADVIGSTRSGSITLDAAVASVVTAAAQEAAVLDAEEPAFVWVACAPHSWFGVSMPNSGYGIENPDNVYRHAGIDGSMSYTIEGRFVAEPPMDFSLVLYGEVPGTGAMAAEGAPILATLTRSQMVVEANGIFVVTLGPDPANGRANHVQTTAEAKLLIARDSLSNWDAESPSELRIVETSPRRTRAASFEARVRDAARYATQLGRYWGIDYNRAWIYSRTANEVNRTPRRRGIGFSTSGHFALRDDEALVVTVDAKRARYLGFQLADPWGVAINYVDRSGSLNNAQAEPNPDGTFTYVISAEDPGVANWLDTGGLDAGLFAIRWQQVPPTEPADDAVRSVRRAPLREVRSMIPSSAPFVDPANRERRLAQRRAAFERRYLGVVGQVRRTGKVRQARAQLDT